MDVRKVCAKSLWFLVIVCLFVVCLPKSTIAAEEYPIEKDTSNYNVEIGYGRSIDGMIYVPLRLLFEVADADVNWDTSSGTITISRCDGAVITMHPGTKKANIAHFGGVTELQMPVAPKLVDGITYVPLRFVGENLMCSVEWDSAAKKIVLQKRYVTIRDWENDKRYTLDFSAGKVYELNANGDIRYLGKPVGMTEFFNENVGSGWDKFWYVRGVTQTPDGSLLIDFYMDAVDSQVWTLWRLLLTPDGQNNRSFICKNHSTVGNRYYLYSDGDNVWWPEKEDVLLLDGKNGSILASYKYQDMLGSMPEAQNYGFVFSDGEYMLLTYQKEDAWYSNFPVLVNLQTGEVTDLLAKLIPESEWADFHYDGAAPSSIVSFVKAQNGVIYFTYRKISGETQEVIYQYK